MFYDIFMELCEEKGVTPAMVRKVLGISQSTMASWKSRGLSPNASTLLQISEYFGTTPAYLLGNRMARYPAPSPQELRSIAFNAAKDPEFAGLVEKLKNNTISPDELRQYRQWLAHGTSNVHRGILATMECLLACLNDEGQEKAVERVQELTEIPRYQRTLEPSETHTEPPEGQSGHSGE